jgi:hypothetical protein
LRRRSATRSASATACALPSVKLWVVTFKWMVMLDDGAPAHQWMQARVPWEENRSLLHASA